MGISIDVDYVLSPDYLNDKIRYVSLGKPIDSISKISPKNIPKVTKSPPKVSKLPLKNISKSPKKTTKIQKVRKYNTTNKTLDILFYGGLKVGKTSIINRFVNNTFSDTYTPTIVLDYESSILSNSVVKLNDTSGEAVWKKNMGDVYTYINVLLLCVDLTNVKSMQYFDKKYIAKCIADPYISVILCGTKSDKKRQINDKYMQDICNRYKLDFYMSTSAKENKNIIKLFKKIRVLIYG